MHASVREWDFPATFGELIAAEHAEWTANAHRDRERSPEPITFPRPWRGEDYIAPEERERLMAAARRRSVFRDQD